MEALDLTPRDRPSWESENPRPVLVRDLSTAEADAEDAGIIREDMTAEQRAESLAEAVHDMIGRERALRAELATARREVVRVLAQQTPIQPLRSFALASIAEDGPAIVATIEAAERLGHLVAAEFERDSFGGLLLTIGVRVAA